MCFKNYGLQKVWLDKCLKSPVSEHLSTVNMLKRLNSSRVNMLKRPKHCMNLHESSFIIIFHHSETDWLAKCQPRFRKSFESQRANTSETLLKSAWQHLYHIFQSFWEILSCMMSLVVICESLGLFVNTLTADDKYFLCNRENLRQPVQMQLSQKQFFLWTCCWFSEFYIKFWTFWNKRLPSGLAYFRK